MLQVTEGKKVKILTSGGEIDPNVYNVRSVKSDLIGLVCKETGITIKVNSQRIFKIINQEEIMSNDAVVIEDVTIETPELTIEKPTTTTTEKTKKSTPEQLDFTTMVNEGFEVWTKTGLSLGADPKVASIQVSAHCVIDPEANEDRGYEVFNSYNGTLGAKGKSGKRYAFTEKNTVEKKRKSLEKKGYILHKV